MLKKLIITSLLLLAACNTPAAIDESTDAVNQDSSSEQSSIEAQITAPTTTLTPDTMETTPQKGDHVATLKTNMGDIKVLLYSEKAPETVKNFEELAKSDKYDKTIFHRVISSFMIQGGDIDNMNGYGGYSYKGKGTYIKDELDPTLTHVYGALSMANSGPNSAGSQFFIVQAKEGTSWLNGKHAVFGFVYEGMDVVEKIAAVDTLPGDKPAQDVVLEDVEIGLY